MNKFRNGKTGGFTSLLSLSGHNTGKSVCAKIGTVFIPAINDGLPLFGPGSAHHHNPGPAPTHAADKAGTRAKPWIPAEKLYTLS